MIAAMIDGVWLRAALSGWREADSASARALLTEFVDRRLSAGRASPDDDRVIAGAANTHWEPGGTAALRLHQSRHRRGAGLRERCRPAEIDAAVRAAQQRPGALGGDDRRGARPRVAPSRADPALAQPRARRARDARYRQADSGDARRRRRFRRGLLRVFRGPRAILERRAHRSRRPGVRLHAARASRRRRRHRCLELSAADRLLEGGARARLRQCHDLQARRDHAVQRREARADIARSRRAGGRFPGGAGLCRHRTVAHPSSRISARSRSPARSARARP